MIPRPPSAVPGGPPPWRPRRGITLASVADAVARRRPLGDGVLAQLRRNAAPASAVLVPLFEEDGEARVVLTRRAATLRTHQGQVSFPGGRIDPGEDPVAAALREAAEEVALDPAVVRPVGFLDPAVTVASGAPITPVVATLAARPVLRPNPAEVDRAFDVSLATLAATFREERWTLPGGEEHPVYFFEVATETVWGATARMVVDLLALVLADSPGPAPAA